MIQITDRVLYAAHGIFGCYSRRFIHALAAQECPDKSRGIHVSGAVAALGYFSMSVIASLASVQNDHSSSLFIVAYACQDDCLRPVFDQSVEYTVNVIPVSRHASVMLGRIMSAE